jgi:hypothetical protein
MKHTQLSVLALLIVTLFILSAPAQVSTGTGTTNFIPRWTGAHSQGNSLLFQSTAGNIGIGTTGPSSKLDVRGSTSISGTLGLRPTGTATSTTAFSSQPLDMTASAFNSGSATAVNQRFRWRVIPFNNNKTSASAFLDLQFGTGAATPVSTGFGIDKDGTLGIFTNNSVNSVGLFVESLKTTTLNWGIVGFADGPSGIGVAGEADNGTDAIGVLGVSANGIGVYGSTDSPTGFAGFFNGNVQIAGTLSKAAGSFKIDHPLDPANKYLSHSFVESPDMMNIYNGVAKLDSNGEIWVTMPDWFDTLNRDFRYQLTPIGAPGPNLYIAEEIAGNRFKIAGGKPSSKVSWQVTGVRADPYANAHRVQVEEDKPANERGHYLSPDLYGAGEEQAIKSGPRAPLQRQANQLAEVGKK